MTYATEYFKVQEALGIENKSNISASPFKQLDAQFADRIEDVTKDVDGFGKVRAIFVDGNMILLWVNGQDVDADPEEVREVLGMNK